MASEDVIELGSSDDEAEPATKKIKPLSNAMVHIPRKLHGVTIKPAKKTVSCIPKELAGKNVTVTKVPKSNVLANPYANKNKTNGKSAQQKPAAFPQVLKKPIVLPNIQNRPINPLSLMKNINSQVVINKIPGSPRPSVLKNPIRIQSPRSINNLPPSITVTRTKGGQKRVAPTTITTAVRKKQKVNNKPKIATTTSEVLTVDLDDDDVSTTSTASPQWYLRPEEQTSSLEEDNNKEPEPESKSESEAETSKPVEITIEDSPVKPIQSKRIHEVGSEPTVTIDDSPVKTMVDKKAASGSDSEAIVENKVPHSKKKLEYPKETETISDTIEIEISPETPTETPKDKDSDSKKEEDKAMDTASENIIEIEESPMKVEGQATSTPKKNHPKPQLQVPESLKELQDDTDLSEFHPIYRSFIKLCFQLENSDDMKKIVEKKIKTYYRQVPKDYTESEEFIDMVAGKILSMKAGPEKMYLYIKDIVDELNLQRKMAKSQVLTSITEKKSADTDNKFLYGEESEYDSKRQRQIRKLEKTLKKLHRAIQKLEEQEVDFDDDEDSVYLLTESDDGSTSNKEIDKQLLKDPKALLQRYKERMVRVHAKFCQLTNTKMPSEPRVQIDARPGHPTGPAKRLEKWINKKVPIGTPLPFPDFHDVLRCVRDANTEDKLGWNEADIMEEARDLFTRCGKKLQRRRQENEWRLAASRISVDVDPAEDNTDLKKKLEDNKKIAAKKETDVFNKFADRQSQLKLEAEEIGDKEAEESPADDDEEDEPNEESLENTEKRKERLKRLLQEKSNKGTDTEIAVNMSEATNSQTDEEHVLERKVDEALERETSKVMEQTSDDLEKQGEDKESDILNKQGDDKETDTLNKQGDDKETDILNKQGDDKEADLLNEQGEDEELLQKPVSPIKPPDKVENENDDIEMISGDTTSISVNKPNNNEESIAIEEEVTIDQPVSSDVAKKDFKEEHDIKTEEKTHCISDDSNKPESDGDELHLLQKLYSETEANTSTQETSDSESPIAISDTLESSSDNKKQTASDVISIENSSYSESEINKEPFDVKPNKDTDSLADKVVAESVDENTEIECSNIGIEKKTIRTNNDEYNESIEDILLASTDDDELEVDKGLKQATEEEDECVNLKDDTISIGDTVVEGVDKTQSNPTSDDNSPGKQDDASSVDSVALVSSKNDSPVSVNHHDMDIVCNDADNSEKIETENESEVFENTEGKQDIVEQSNDNNEAETIELKESSSEEIMDPTDKSNDSSDCQNKEQSPEKENVFGSTESAEHEPVPEQNVEDSNNSSDQL